MPQTFTKDPEAVLDYTIDWSQYLVSGDTLATSSWIVPYGLTSMAEAHSDLTATIWLGGGMAGAAPYVVTNHITTIGGRVDERSITITVTQQ